MKILVIADIHLDFSDSREKFIIEFFRKIACKYNKIIILGDFFEFWVGLKNVLFFEYFNVLAELKKLRDKGIEIIFIEGNHDFNMGDFFAETLKIQVCEEYYSMNVNSKKFLFLHGDTINLKEDRFYSFLRLFLRSKFVKFLINNIPAYMILKIAKKFSSTSRKYLYKDFDLKRVIDNYEKCADFDFIISGHYHLNFNYKNFYILGDWFDKFNYIEITESGDIEYKIFYPGDLS